MSAETTATGAGPALLERERESALLRDALTAAGSGGSLIVLEGAPGIGKSRLLATARAAALAAGMQVLTARGDEFERGVPFALLRQALDPLVLGAEPARRAELFDGAAVRAASVFDPAGPPPGRPEDVLPALHGLFWLVSDVARTRPVALLLDDLQ